MGTKKSQTNVDNKQSLEEYKNQEQESAFIRAITQGLLEIKEGKEQSLESVKMKLGIKT